MLALTRPQPPEALLDWPGAERTTELRQSLAPLVYARFQVPRFGALRLSDRSGAAPR
jgi:hypothetical protein